MKKSHYMLLIALLLNLFIAERVCAQADQYSTLEKNVNQKSGLDLNDVTETCVNDFIDMYRKTVDSCGSLNLLCYIKALPDVIRCAVECRNGRDFCSNSPNGGCGSGYDISYNDSHMCCPEGYHYVCGSTCYDEMPLNCNSGGGGSGNGGGGSGGGEYSDCWNQSSKQACMQCCAPYAPDNQKYVDCFSECK
jgi:hypothetical protein